MSLRIVQRPLKQKEIDTLIVEVRHTPHITYIPTKEWQRFARMYIIEDTNQFIGCCAVIPLEKWTKLGPFVILREYHGQGYAKKLLTAVVNNVKKDNLFLLSFAN